MRYRYEVYFPKYYGDGKFYPTLPTVIIFPSEYSLDMHKFDLYLIYIRHVP